MASHDQPEFQQQYTNEYPHDSDKTLERQTTAAHQQAHPHLYSNPQAIHPAFGGALQPGLWKPVEHRKFANPAPLGLCAFALTTFVLSCINMHVRGESSAAIAIPVAFGYGGLVQLCAGMWYVYLQPNTSLSYILTKFLGKWLLETLLVLLLFHHTEVSGLLTVFSKHPPGTFLVPMDLTRVTLALLWVSS